MRDGYTHRAFSSPVIIISRVTTRRATIRVTRSMRLSWPASVISIRASSPPASRRLGRMMGLCLPATSSPASRSRSDPSSVARTARWRTCPSPIGRTQGKLAAEKPGSRDGNADCAHRRAHLRTRSRGLLDPQLHLLNGDLQISISVTDRLGG